MKLERYKFLGFANKKFAIKCVEAGVDAVVAEGFEAGGHNGRDETTTFCLTPMVRKVLNILKKTILVQRLKK